MGYYELLPEVPAEVSATGIIKRLVDAFGFRYQLSTKDITNEQYLFRPVESSMSIEEVNRHILRPIILTANALEVKHAKAS